jgi:hypothetical protein
MRTAPPDYAQQAKRRDDLGHPLWDSGTDMRRELKYGEAEHHMCQPHAKDGAGDLRQDVGWHRMPSHPAGCRCGQRHHRVHMRTGARSKSQDQRDQRPTRRNGIGQKRQAVISAAQPLSHDSRANHADQQERRRDQFNDRMNDDRRDGARPRY